MKSNIINVFIGIGLMLFTSINVVGQPNRKSSILKYAYADSIPKTLKLGSSVSLPRKSIDSLFENAFENGIKMFEIGYFGVENISLDSIRNIILKIRKSSEDFGIELWSVHLPFGKLYDISQVDETKRIEAVELQKRFIDLSILLGVKYMNLHPSTEPIPDELRIKYIQSCRKSIKELLKYISGKPVHLMIEDLPRTCLARSISEMAEIISGFPELGICFDTNHLLMDDPEDFIQVFGNRIKSVHISDYDKNDEKHWLPGWGDNNWNKIMFALLRGNYQGPFMYEVSRKYADFADLNENFKNLKKNYYGVLSKFLIN